MSESGGVRNGDLSLVSVDSGTAAGVLSLDTGVDVVDLVLLFVNCSLKLAGSVADVLSLDAEVRWLTRSCRLALLLRYSYLYSWM